MRWLVRCERSWICGELQSVGLGADRRNRGIRRSLMNSRLLLMRIDIWVCCGDARDGFAGSTSHGSVSIEESSGQSSCCGLSLVVQVRGGMGLAALAVLVPKICEVAHHCKRIIKVIIN